MKELNFDTKNNFYLYPLLILFFFFLTFNSYFGSYHSGYINNIKYVFNKDLFINDIFLKNSITLNSTIFYKFLYFFRINLDNDYLGFFIHVIVSFFSGYYLIKILKKNLYLSSKYYLIIIILLIPTDGSLIESSRSSWIINHSNTPTYFVSFLRILFIYYLLDYKLFKLTVVSCMMLLIALGAAWFVLGLGYIYLLSSLKKKKHFLWFFFPLIISFIFLTKVNYDLTYYQRLYLFNESVLRNYWSGSFYFQPKFKIATLFLSFILYFFLIKDIKNSKFKNFLNILLYFSIFIFLFNLIYIKFFGRLFPEPKIVVLNFPIALGFYQTFFWIVFFNFLIQRINNEYFKITSLVVLYILLFSTYKHFILATMLLSILLFIYLFIKKYNFNSFFLKNHLLLFLIILLPIHTYYFYKKLKNEFDYYSLVRINKWTTGDLVGNNQRVGSSIALQKCNDFILLDVDGNNNGPSLKMTNHIAQKSNLFGGIHHSYFNYDLVRLYQDRNNMRDVIEKSIKDKKMFNHDIVNFLIKNKVIVIINKKNIDLIPPKIFRKNLYKNDYLVFFTSNVDTNKILKECQTY
jgi:hypothetical protein